MNTEIFDLGKIGITIGGEYDNNVIYEKLTIVLYKGKSYISTKTVQGLSPEQDIRSWQLVAEAKDAYHMLVDAGKTTLTEEEFLEQLVDATKGRYIVQGNIINAADEEDLTVEHSDLLGIDTLKLANRDNTNGIGYVILRKNKSFAEQVTKENTIYEIRYNFDLNGQEITIPERCILKFDGGSISNGTINGNSSIIISESILIFKNIIISGTWLVPNIYQSWFNFDLTELADNRNNFKNLIQLTNADIINTVFFNSGTYYTKVYEQENINEEALFLLNSNTTLHLNDCVIKTIPFKYTNKKIILIKNANNVNIYGGHLLGDADLHDYDETVSSTHEHSHGIKIGHNSQNIIINNTIIEKFTGDGIEIIDSGENMINNIQITNVICDANNRQGISIESGKNIYIKNSQFINTSSIHVTAPGCGLDIEPWIKGVHIENVYIENCVFENNKGNVIIQPNLLEDDKVFYENNISISKSIINHITIDNCNTIKINEIKNVGGIKLRNTKNIDISNVNIELLEIYEILENLSLVKCSISDRMIVSENTNNNNNIKITDCSINNLNCTNLKKLEINNSIINIFAQYRIAEYTSIKDSKISQFKYLSGTVNLWNNNIQFENTQPIYLSGEIVGNIISKNTNGSINLNNAVINHNIITNTSTSETLFWLFQTDGIYEFINNQIQGFKYLCGINVAPKKVKIYLNNPIILCRHYIDPNTIEVIDGCLDIKDNIIRIYKEGNWYSLNLTNPNAIERPTTNFSGQSFFDKSLNCPIWWNGDKWIDGSGNTAYLNKGNTNQRPILTSTDEGFEYYDSTLKKKILWNGTTWVNIDGTSL